MRRRHSHEVLSPNALTTSMGLMPSAELAILFPGSTMIAAMADWAG
ncbi:hypothetical protein OPEN69S_00477 [Ottowia pentelensis]